LRRRDAVLGQTASLRSRSQTAQAEPPGVCDRRRRGPRVSVVLRDNLRTPLPRRIGRWASGARCEVTISAPRRNCLHVSPEFTYDPDVGQSRSRQQLTSANPACIRAVHLPGYRPMVSIRSHLAQNEQAVDVAICRPGGRASSRLRRLFGIRSLSQRPRLTPPTQTCCSTAGSPSRPTSRLVRLLHPNPLSQGPWPTRSPPARSG